jgi:hypothetical protein
MSIDGLPGNFRELYAEASKHSQYQPLPAFAREGEALASERYSHFKLSEQRLSYILNSGIFSDVTSVVEVGANIGFFSLSIAHDNPGIAVKTIEANDVFCVLSRQIGSHFSVDNIDVENDFFPFLDEMQQPQADVCMIFNVLHHGGAEFDQDKCESADAWYEYLQTSLSASSARYKKMVLQLGYNWGGDVNTPIHDSMDPVGFARNLVKRFFKSGWGVSQIGIPVRDGESFEYEALSLAGKDEASCLQAIENSSTLHNCSSFTVSEFFRRPIFLLDRL